MPRNLTLAVRSVLAAIIPVALCGAPSVAAEPVQHAFTVDASDGVELRATLTSPDATAPRPTVVEFSPYGRNSGTLAVGPAYNTLLVQIRGTGDSDGSFDALGPRTQKDVREVL